MFIQLAIKRRKSRQIGYNQDFCMNCQQAVIAELWQYQSWLSIFWTPIIPLGKRQQWLCHDCQKKTSGRYHSNFASKLLMSCLAIAVTVLLFQPEAEQHAQIAWLRGLATILTMGCLLWLYKHHPKPSHQQQRQRLAPLSLSHCHFCHRPLYIGLSNYCQHCQLKVYRKIDDIKVCDR